MDLIQYFSVLVILFIDKGHTGGHGGKHHSHVRLHIPEFIHHGHHTKVITIHHHHHKPKKEHHHHHHHHPPKPSVPYGHHYHKHRTKLRTTTVSKGKNLIPHHHDEYHGPKEHRSYYGSRDFHGHSDDQGQHNRYGPHGYNGYQGYQPPRPNANRPHQEPPSYNYDPTPTTFEEDFGSFSPAGHAFSEVAIGQNPRIRGVSHTVKQVKVFDSLPGALPSVPSLVNNNQVYQVTEDDDGEDSYSAVNSLSPTDPHTYGFVRGAAPTSNDPFAAPTPQIAEVPGGIPIQTHDPFAPGHQQIENQGNTIGEENLYGSPNIQSFSPSDHSAGPNIQIPPEFNVVYQSEGNVDDPQSFVGDSGSAFASGLGDAGEDAPVSFSREAGIQQTIRTGGVETLLY